jgi:hypothetical protein
MYDAIALMLDSMLLQLVYGQLEFELMVPDSKSWILIAPSAVKKWQSAFV